MSVNYPIFAFAKDDPSSLCLIEGESQILHHLEAIDIGNDEYVFWDANGDGVSIAVSVSTFKSRLEVCSCPAAFPIREAFVLYAKSFGLPAAVAEGTPTDAWRRIQAELAGRPKKRGFLSKLFSV